MIGLIPIVVLVDAATACHFISGRGATGTYGGATGTYGGWSKMKHAFIFGDSYTTVGFNDTLEQPSGANAIGNPAYPGSTTANGPNWADFITAKYNQSLILTYDLAYSGATIDDALVEPQEVGDLSLEQQINEEFIPVYGTTTYPGTVQWESSDSLFAIFIGINDVRLTYASGTTASTAINSKIFAEYQGLMETLYYAGARNFLFLNVPPIDRSPLTQASGPASQALEKTAIAAWNGLVVVLAKTLKKQHQDVNVFMVDTNTIFTKVLNDPNTYNVTAGYKNTTAYCQAYENGTPQEDTFIPSCGVPVNQYFWLNTLHPTYPIHDALAFEVTNQLKAGPNI